jgi:fluoroquinolone resistance protein
MSAHQLIIDHDKWRRGKGGAPAGVSGSDGNGYSSLDLNLITFTGGDFNGSSFVSTTFEEASWQSCQFIGVNFNNCDLTSIRMSA